jgi:hypothetical protein
MSEYAAHITVVAYAVVTSLALIMIVEFFLILKNEDDD